MIRTEDSLLTRLLKDDDTIPWSDVVYTRVDYPSGMVLTLDYANDWNSAQQPVVRVWLTFGEEEWTTVVPINPWDFQALRTFWSELEDQYTDGNPHSSEVMFEQCVFHIASKC